MRKEVRRALAAVLAMLLTGALLPPASARAAGYTPPYQTVRIGIYTYNSSGSPVDKTFASSNLQNVKGTACGYRFGYFDADRSFVDLGVSVTDTDSISVLMDRNMVYSPNSYSLLSGSASGTVVGCYHVLMASGIPDAAAAVALAGTLDGGFVRYENGSFKVLAGQFTSGAAAVEAASAAGLTVDSGTSYTVTVVETGTNRILFEFDCGANYSIGIMPIAADGVKAQTWHRDCKFYGGFSFLRNTGGQLTTVNYVDVEDYVKGVVCYEMSPGWPLEALKAQAISARTFLMSNIKKHRTLGFDICNTTDCQAYHGTGSASANSDMAVDETAGQYLMYNGELCETYYYSSNGGASENSENVWVTAIPYLRGVIDPYEKDIAGKASQYYYTVSYTPSQLAQRLRDKGRDCSDIAEIRMTFTEVGNVKSMTFVDTRGRSFTVDKDKIRAYTGCRSIRFSVNGLGGTGAAVTPESPEIYVNGAPLEGGLSGAFALGGFGMDQLSGGDLYAVTGSGQVEKLGESGAADPVTGNSVRPDASGKFVFSGAGYGHNVGMSQWGAYSMANYYNKTCEEILTFYYTGTQVVRAG